jgi:enoyl-CoA hydratase/carnithine racemase
LLQNAHTAQKLAEKPAGALQASKRLMRQSTREHLERAAKAENEEYFVRLRTPESKEALTAFLEKRSPNFNRATQATPAA